MNNVEKLRNYFLGKDPQLKETMADNSLRLIGIEGKHFVLRTEMLKRLIELKKQVDDKDEELQGEVDQIILDLADEARIREETDLALNGNFNLLDGEVSDLRGVVNGIKATVPYTAITQDIRIYEDNPVIAGLSGTGWYYTGEHAIYYEDSVEPVCKENTIFYYSDDGEDKYLTFFPATMTSGYEILKAIIWWSLDENKWISDGWWVTYTLSPDSTDNQIPTAAAVAQTLTDNFQVKFVTVLAGDMTLTPDIADGLYYTDTYAVKYNGNTVIPPYTLFSSKNYSLGIAIKTVEMQNPTHTRTIGYLTSLGSWSFGEEDYITSDNLAQTISSSSSNTSAPSAKAVYDFAGEHYSTTERVVGTWTDGKPLYEKTIINDTPLYGNTYMSGIENASTAFVVSGFAEKNNDVYMLPYSASSTYIRIDLLKGATDIVPDIMTSVNDGSVTKVAITVRYTKTTD